MIFKIRIPSLPIILTLVKISVEAKYYIGKGLNTLACLSKQGIRYDYVSRKLGHVLNLIWLIS